MTSIFRRKKPQEQGNAVQFLRLVLERLGKIEDLLDGFTSSQKLIVESQLELFRSMKSYYDEQAKWVRDQKEMLEGRKPTDDDRIF